MGKGKKRIGLLFICLMLAGCSGSQNTQQAEKELETGFIPARAGMYDSADTAVIRQINKAKNTITFYNLVRERSYTLNFNGATGLYDKYGTSVSIEQVNEGDIVDITFLKGKKMLASLKMSDSSFKLDNVKKFTLNEKTKELTIGDNTYRFEDNLFIVSEGNQVEIMDINQVDTLVVQGIDNVVYSIAIDKGHGYLRLKNDEYFWGGWIEVGQEIIRTIEEDMLLVVPEGEYEVVLSTKGITGVKRIQVKRNKETELDIGDLKTEEVKKFGTLIIAVWPDAATVYIDGEEADITAPCQVEYGIHQLMAKAEGYQTVIQYIKVGQENATLEIVMEKETEASVSSNSITNTVSANDITSASGGKLTIDAPAGVEVYVDGSYIGISPVSFTKTMGVHVITLRAEGYQTKSYTINVDDTVTNESMSFSALVKEEEKTEDDESENDKKNDSDDKSNGGTDNSDDKDDNSDNSSGDNKDDNSDDNSGDDNTEGEGSTEGDGSGSTEGGTDNSGGTTEGEGSSSDGNTNHSASGNSL